jgi:hypothetical protein
LIADGQPEQTKALLRLLIAELRVNSKADIQPTYRVLRPGRFLTAGVCATSGKVETVGIEPTQRSRREEVVMATGREVADPRGLAAIAAVNALGIARKHSR